MNKSLSSLRLITTLSLSLMVSTLFADGHALEDAKIQASLDSAYDQFKDVSEGANADYIPVLAEVDSNIFGIALVTADGRVFTGQRAKELGFIDTLGSFDLAVDIAGALAGIEKPNLVYPPKRLRLIDILIAPMENVLLPKLYFLWQ